MKITHKRSSGFQRRAASAAASVVAVGVGMLLLVAPASANAPITSYSALPSTTQAGGHPDVEVAFAVKNRRLQVSQSACNCEDAKDAAVHLPTGFIGDPHATPQCSIAEFSTDSCPIDSQVGIANVLAGGFSFNSALYNLVPPPDVAGLLGFKIFDFNTPQFTVLSARTGGDYGLDATATSIYHAAYPLEALKQILWGVPADPSHDPLRLDSRFTPNGPGTTAYLGNFCDANGAHSTADPSTVVQPCDTDFVDIPPAPSNSPLTPFLQNPTTCASPLASSLDVLSYDGGTDHADSAWPQATGCDQLSFNPSLYAQPTTTATDTASGIDINLTIPQQQSPSIPSPTELRAATVTLPAGFSINPNAADGKTSCSDADANFSTTLAANCPDFSKVGSLEIDSSALPGPLPGFVYLGQPLPGNRYRIFLVADGFATHIKLAGTVTPDPVTGQLVVSFQNLPQSPLTAFDMHFFGSERGLLATPTQCGTYPVTTTFTPWDETIGTQTSTQFFTLDSGPNGTPCPGANRPLDPSFTVGVTDNTAGVHTDFTLSVTRNDGDQNLSALNVSTPPGFTATLAGVPYCPDAALAAAAGASYSGTIELTNPSCPTASQIGTATTGAGAGTHPLYVPGKVYLAGPYKGAPLSLAVITPAVSGPYDLGNVVVRVALHVDPSDAHITAVSDPLPQILQGIPLRLRSILLNLDRPNFALNPTNCDPFSINATAFGDQGAQANLTSGFQVASCTDLGFSPKLALKFIGGTKRNAHPALHATLTAKADDANISRVAVTLPPTELLDQSHIGSSCTRAQYAASSCPANTVIGTATAVTPLLDKPLTGTVYLESNGNPLPDIAVALRGQIDIDLHGKVDTVNGGLRTTFQTVPDAPVASFNLNLLGGSKGLIVNSRPVCGQGLHAVAKIAGQNGKSADQNPALQAACGKARHKRHLTRGRAVR